MSIQTLVARGRYIALMASELAPGLQAVAVTGSMLEFADPTRTRYVSEDIASELLPRVRDFAGIISQHAADLRETGLKDVTLAEALASASMEVSDRDYWPIIDRTSVALEEFGKLLAEVLLENPNWRKWRKVAVAITAAAGVGVGVVTLSIAVAVGAGPLAVVSLAIEIAVGLATLADTLPELRG